MMNREIMTCIAVLIFAFTAARAAFAQTDEGSAVSSETEFTAEAVDELPAPEYETAVEQAAPKKKKDKSQDSPAKDAAAVSETADADEPAEPKKKKRSADDTAVADDQYASAGSKKNKKEKGAADEAAPAKDETKFKLSGLLEAGMDVINRVNRGTTENRLIGRGEIEISARPIKKLRAEFGIEYDMRDTFVVIDKMYAQYSLPGDGMIRAGIMKKTFGHEERAGVDERYFHRRSIINDGLEELRFLDHDLTAMYRHEAGRNWRFVGAFSYSAAAANPDTAKIRPNGTDTMYYYQNYSAQYRDEKLDVVLAAVVRHFVPREWWTTSFAAALACNYKAAPWWVSEAEVTFGANPKIKVLEDRDAYIAGIRVQEYFPISVNTNALTAIIPIVEAAVYCEDMESRDYDTQIRGGLALGFTQNAQFQFRNTYGLVLRTVDGKTVTRRNRFDSEVVVIF